MKPKLLIILSVLLLLVLWGWRSGTFGVRAVDETAITPLHPNAASDPCLFMDAGSEESMKSRSRQFIGYEKAIPLAEAVRIVNEEMSCSPLYSSYPALTEDEVIAAIVTNADYRFDESLMKKRQETLTQIALDRELPKGALLMFDGKAESMYSPLNPDGSISADGIKISLILDVGEHGGNTGTPFYDNVLIIRKTFSGYKRENR